MKRIQKSFTITLGVDTGQVLLSTSVGNGALGGGNVKVNGALVKKGLLDRFPLGTVSNLKGKTYTVRTNGLDVNPATDEIPVTHLFTGNGLKDGDVRFEFPEKADGKVEADKEDGLISYIVEYTFN